jgi:flagellar P-ring protein precursor FlgI
MILRNIIFSFLIFSNLFAIQIKDVTNIVGVRENELIGYGLIVGLNGTGDGNSLFTQQSVANMLQSVNVKISPTAIKPKNVAAVMVTAKLPSFARQGDKLDILVSSIGDAKSLEGGILLLTPLKGVDGKIYALSQGSVTIGGKDDGSGKAHPTVATIFGGATVEREINIDLYNTTHTKLSLDKSNFENAIMIQDILNRYFHNKVAVAIDPRTIELVKPDNMSMIEFLAEVEDIEIIYKKEKKIVIDERTGTIVAGIDIRVSPVVITHEDITIKISSKDELIESAGTNGNENLGDGVIIGKNNNILATEDKSPTIANVTRALKKLGATPKDMIAILEAMKKSGAIDVKLEIL